MKPSQPLEYQARVSPPKSLADKESGLRKDAGRDSSVDLVRAENQADLDAKTVPGAKQENAEVQVQAQAANVQSQNQSNSNSKIPGPAPLGQAEPKKMKAASARTGGSSFTASGSWRCCI